MINMEKTKVLQKPVTSHDFRLAEKCVEVTYQYRYLGVVLNTHLDLNVTSDALVSVSSRALSCLISKTKDNLDLGYRSYTKLYNSIVLPTLDYEFGAWGPAQEHMQKRWTYCCRELSAFIAAYPTAPLFKD